ncbi:MAG: response regulator [Polyangiaceae bacterium]|nr:response regulator [Polyangiaceae bacterium]
MAEATPGEMSERVRSFDWSSTPLGPIESWSPALRTLTSILLANRFPMLLWWGPDSVSIYNDAYIPVLGAKHPAALGQPVREVWTEIYDVLRPLIQTPLFGGPPTWSEDLLLEIRRHGFLEETHWTIAYSPVPDPTAPNGIGGVLATVNEITAQVVGKRRNELLLDLARAREARSVEEACSAAAAAFQRAPADVAFALIYLFDEDGRTASLRATAGTTPPSPHVIELVDGQLPAVFGDSRVLPLDTGALVVGLSPRLEDNASYRGFLDLAAASLASAIANARAYDVERRRAEALAELDRAKTSFFGNVSHELRTPLTLILGHVGEALETSLPPELRRQQETVQRNALRLLKLVNSLLDFSRIEAGRAEASFEKVDLGALTAETASAFRSLIEGAGLDLEIACDPIQAAVFVDRQMWEQIVLNLLSNAFKFTKSGTITVRLTSDASSVRLDVRDTGIGIDASELPRVFDRFYRANSGPSARTYEGTGIGLALVHELAKMHGGTAGATSEKGKGSTFTITIPTGSAHLPADRIRASRSSNPTIARTTSFLEEAAGWGDGPREAAADVALKSPAQDAPSTRIVVADDNADMRAYLQRLLQPIGVVELVKDGNEALAAIQRQPPDLVLSDVMMPGLDGFALLRALRADPSTATLPVVLLSARAGEDSRIDGAIQGADDYIVKPFSARELTARVRAQLVLARLRREHADALLTSEAKFRALVTASSDAVYRMGPDWKEMRHLVGRDFIADTSDPEHSWLEKYIAPEDQPQVTAAIEQAIRTKSPFELEHRVRRIDGTLGWTYSRAIPLLDKSGEIIEWLGTADDITERRQAEERLREANARLAEADQAKNEFLAMLSHELRNPLTPIVTGLVLLKKLPPGNPDAKRTMGIIDRQVGQLSNLVNDLLDMTRITRNTLELHKEPMELNEVVRLAVADNQAFFDAARVRLEHAAAPSDIPVIADRTRLRQVVGNLLHNAAKFTSAGGSTRVSVTVEGREAVVRVVDDGVGMAKENLARLFEPFVQANQALDRSKGGLGLGLAVVKRLVELHDGSVTARSEGLGQGTELTVRLPVAEAQTASSTTPQSKKAASGMRVLVVEDNLDSAKLMGAALGMRGHAVAIAHNGPDALDEARRFGPDAVLCDIGLPEMSGYDVARAFRADDALKRAYLIALTGYAHSDDVRRASEAGFDCHLAKPPSFDELDRILSSVRTNQRA